jgi:hypothetical protein
VVAVSVVAASAATIAFAVPITFAVVLLQRVPPPLPSPSPSPFLLLSPLPLSSSSSLFLSSLTSSLSHCPCLSSCQNQPGMHLVRRLVVASKIEVVMIVFVIFVVRADPSEVVDSARHVFPDYQQAQLIVG